MSMKLKTTIKGSVIALVMLMSSGCATELQNQIDALNAKVNQLSTEQASMRSAADAASAAATQARQMASGAQSTANRALDAASKSQSCCDATNEKIDRMFQRSQSK